MTSSAPPSEQSTPLAWDGDDRQAVTYLRALAMDAVQSVGNGHPGTAMSLAPIAYLLYRDYVRHDPSDPAWPARDRFVLSAGHSSLTLYSQLFLSGIGVDMDDLRSFRRWGSLTPGHPEFGHTPGVETTTGPLGQGVATAVGMAMAARFERGLFDPDSPDSPFDYRVWVLASDGDLEEGISAEASSLAGRQQLANLCVVWDDNRISIEGDTALHGSALGDDEVAATKSELGLDPSQDFAFDESLLERIRSDRATRGAAHRTTWAMAIDTWRALHPERAALLDRLTAHDLPADMEAALPSYESGAAVATRKASGDTISALAAVLPELWGGSADLAESNNTSIAGAKSFLPEETATSSPFGRVIHFGIREHAMGAIVNGIALDGLTRPFCGTFLVFSDYMRGAVRLAALMQTPSTFVWTHDSIGLGEDGPTHQPIEHLWSLRAIPGFAVCRPADARETSAAWLAILRRREPIGIVLSRQGLPVLDTEPTSVLEGVHAGGYLVRHTPEPRATIMATGSEVHLALQAAENLADEGIEVNVASLPCLEWFNQQEQSYRDSVIRPDVRPRVAVEAGSTIGWHRYVGDDGAIVGVDHFGASGDASRLFSEFGVTADAVADATRRVVAAHSS
ncbi:MAG: transketolase [Actinobacteria bacterium]|nr:transketolase [Actinomycetota bacterium]